MRRPPSREHPLDLYGGGVVTADEVKRGDIVLAIAPSRRYCRNERDLLRVSSVSEGDVYGFRVFPQAWEREVEFVIFASAIEGRRLRRLPVGWFA